ncbi:thiocillin family RiPP [Streptomyces sp. 769]|uniref:thiocillin family RiPP n=1 Tax=Streptomyces sp. 769 TaxID=1262452 RepID=UPI00057D19A6|nr:thiocillin family RiPP [Streptomyces sp. 769]
MNTIEITDPAQSIVDAFAIDLAVEDMTVESLDESALLGTVGSGGSVASASCPVGSASTVATASSAS